MLNKEKQNLTRSLKNDRNNKDLLRTEINNATDPNVRLELTKMLVEIEKEEKKKRLITWTILVLVVIIIFSFLFYLGNKPSEEKIISRTSNTQKNPSDSTNNIETTESTISETNLSEEQLKEWVMSILNLNSSPQIKYYLDVHIDETDNLAYIDAALYQSDSIGTFRVNAKGQLEFKASRGSTDWVLMSDKFMDTSIAKKYYEEQEIEQNEIDKTINEVKSQLIGKTFSVQPILYDGIDAEQAMNENKAPQNLIHDGVQTITFTDDASIHIELLGTYRPDYDDTYSVSAETINLKNYSIPYIFNNGNLSFKTWTTDIDGHTITWSITPQ